MDKEVLEMSSRQVVGAKYLRLDNMSQDCPYCGRITETFLEIRLAERVEYSGALLHEMRACKCIPENLDPDKGMNLEEALEYLRQEREYHERRQQPERVRELNGIIIRILSRLA